MQLRPHQEQAVKAMLRNTKGQVIVPTGGGKTICMIEDAKNELSRTNTLQTIVVVAPRIPVSYTHLTLPTNREV